MLIIGGELREGDVCARDDMACHPLCVDYRGKVVIGAARAAEQGSTEVAGCAAEESKGSPPVRSGVLIAVAVGDGVEDGKDRGEGGVNLGEGLGRES